MKFTQTVTRSYPQYDTARRDFPHQPRGAVRTDHPAWTTGPFIRPRHELIRDTPPLERRRHAESGVVSRLPSSPLATPCVLRLAVPNVIRDNHIRDDRPQVA